jgi:hypothetical protein
LAFRGIAVILSKPEMELVPEMDPVFVNQNQKTLDGSEKGI